MKDLETAPKTGDTVNAYPVKSFFVDMLTRDISLPDAILDLLDNCVDGLLRTKGRRGVAKPYEGFWAEIGFGGDNFNLSDNCGGIPWSLHDYAFRMGRPASAPHGKSGTVGVYGIGMKRAIFKIGERCLVSTKSGADGYEVKITPEWIRNEEDWQIPVVLSDKILAKEDGTTIHISDLREDISTFFNEHKKDFESVLSKLISTQYALIIDKGFSVKINGVPVTSKPAKLIFTKHAGIKQSPIIRPFIFESEIDGVKVFLAVGFTRPIPSQSEIEDEQEAVKHRSSEDAGWTVVCNDRVVLYCDRSELTGWGEAGVPKYHTQFIAISGIVEFKSDDPLKLPTNTTKRGIDSNSRLYLQVKNKMREGMQIFTDYTNKWKGREDESKIHIEAGAALSIAEIKKEAGGLVLTPTRRTVPEGKQYKPHLPKPMDLEPSKRRISFVRAVEDIRRVSEYLFKGDEDVEPSKVGEECFRQILNETRGKTR